MTLAPLLDAPYVIQVHALAAITAFAIGLVQLTAPKGTIPHRLIGWSWVMLMLTVAVSSLFIHKIRLWGPWSPIHLLSILVLVTLPLAVLHALRTDLDLHRMNHNPFDQTANPISRALITKVAGGVGWRLLF